MAITARDLVPGRIITSLEYPSNIAGAMGRFPLLGSDKPLVIPWLIVGVVEHVKRRHSWSKAKRLGWTVTLFRIGSKQVNSPNVLECIDLREEDLQRWKRLPQ